MSLLAIKSVILESITNIGGPWERGMGGGGTCPPPNFTGSTGGGHMPPPHFYRIHNDLKSLFEKNKQIRKFRKISSKCVQIFKKISNILQNFFKNFSTNHP